MPCSLRTPAADNTLLINVDASTNLLFANDDGFFIRNIQIGGNTLTQSILRQSRQGLCAG